MSEEILKINLKKISIEEFAEKYHFIPWTYGGSDRRYAKISKYGMVQMTFTLDGKFEEYQVGCRALINEMLNNDDVFVTYDKKK